jgi:aspartate racemase
MHVGLIGGIGPAATDFYYRGLVDRHRAANTPLDCTIAHADVGTMGRNLAAGRRAEQAAIFAGLIERLKKAGAEVAAVTSMGGHFCINELLPISPLPLVHGIQAVEAGIKTSGLKKIGVLGTRLVMDTKLYGGIPSAELIAPDDPMFDRVADSYSAMANIGRVTDEQHQVFLEAGRTLVRDKGCEAIMLGGTDLFLAFVGHPPGFPLVDCADIHVEAIFARSSAG